MITLFGCVHFFNFVSFLLYPTEVKRLKCTMLGAFTVHYIVLRHEQFLVYLKCRPGIHCLLILIIEP